MEACPFLKSATARRWHDVAYWGVLLAACAVFGWMNWLTPFKEDDMLHSLIIGDLSHANSIGDLLRSYWNKYFVLNGRSADMVAELFCALLGKPLFNVCNTLMFGLLLHVVSLLATGRRSLLAVAMVLACIGTCYPVPGETLLWLAGSCNYLWTITATLALLLYLRRHVHGQPVGWGRAVLLAVLAFMAGAGNEAMSFAFIAAAVAYYLLHRDRVDRVVLITLLAYALGALMILASPAAWDRAADGGIVVNLQLRELLLSRWHIVSEKMLRFVTPVAALVVGLGYLLRRGFRATFTSLWTLLMLMLVLFMAALGMMTERPYAPLATVSLLIVIIAVHRLLARRWCLLRVAATCLLLALSAFTAARGVGVLRHYQAFEAPIIAAVRTAPSQAILPERQFSGYSRFLYPLRFQSGFYFTNEYIWRAYFDKDNVQFVPDSVYARYHGDRLLDGAVTMPFTSDQPALTDSVLAFPGQDYMVVPLRADTVPTTYQVGIALWYADASALTAAERDYRRNHAMQGGGDPFGYYPLLYHGQVLMVMPLASDRDSCLVVPLHYREDRELRLYRTASNPHALRAVTPNHQ